MHVSWQWQLCDYWLLQCVWEKCAVAVWMSELRPQEPRMNMFHSLFKRVPTVACRPQVTGQRSNRQLFHQQESSATAAGIAQSSSKWQKSQGKDQSQLSEEHISYQGYNGAIKTGEIPIQESSWFHLEAKACAGYVSKCAAPSFKWETDCKKNWSNRLSLKKQVTPWLTLGRDHGGGTEAVSADPGVFHRVPSNKGGTRFHRWLSELWQRWPFDPRWSVWVSS